jgi:hypothetical protein
MYQHIIEDVATSANLGQVPFEDFDFEDILAGAGGANATLTLPGDDDWDLAAHYVDLVASQKRMWHIVRDGEIVWSGIIWAEPDYNPSTRQIKISAAQMHSITRTRRVRDTLKWVGADELDIAGDLVRYMQGHQLLHTIDAPVTYTRPGNAELGIAVIEGDPSGQTRTRIHYRYEDVQVGSTIEEMAGAQGGFEWRFDAYLDGDLILRRFTTAIRLGRVAAESGLVFTLGGNDLAFKWVIDGTRGANSVTAVGAGEADNMLIATGFNADAWADGYPLLEDSVSYKNERAWSTLSSHAAAAATERGFPVQRPQIEVGGQDPDYSTYSVGDEARVVVQAHTEPRFPAGLDAAWRIVRRKVVVAADGSGERVTLTFNPPTAFPAPPPRRFTEVFIIVRTDIDAHYLVDGPLIHHLTEEASWTAAEEQGIPSIPMSFAAFGLFATDALKSRPGHDVVTAPATNLNTPEP